MSDKQNPTKSEAPKINADSDSEISEEQLDQVAGGKVDMVNPTAFESPQGGTIQSGTPIQGLNIKKPGGFLPLE